MFMIRMIHHFQYLNHMGWVGVGIIMSWGLAKSNGNTGLDCGIKVGLRVSFKGEKHKTPYFIRRSNVLHQ